MTALSDEQPGGDDTSDGELSLGEGAVVDPASVRSRWWPTQAGPTLSSTRSSLPW